MSPAHVLEPTYQAIKARLKEGLWPAGFRLDTARLADELGVSTSPVRDSLNHLAGERMVDFASGEGFHVPRLDEKRLRDLLDYNLGLLLLAVAGGSSAVLQLGEVEQGTAEETAVWFMRLAETSGNGELARAVAGLNDRLSAMRRLDPLVLPDHAEDLLALRQALSGRATPGLVRGLLTRYHVVRKLNAEHYVRGLASGHPRRSM